MMFTSLKDMLTQRRLCPLCNNAIHFGFQVVGGRAFIKYSQRSSDVFMNVDIERNWATCNNLSRTFRDGTAAWDKNDPTSRPSFRNLTHPPENGALTAVCRTPIRFPDAVTAFSDEYQFTYDISLNRMKNRVEQILVNNETYKILDGYDRYYISVRHGAGEVIVTRLSEDINRSQKEKMPMAYFTNLTRPTRESLLRKIKTIRVMKDK